MTQPAVFDRPRSSAARRVKGSIRQACGVDAVREPA